MSAPSRSDVQEMAPGFGDDRPVTSLGWEAQKIVARLRRPKRSRHHPMDNENRSGSVLLFFPKEGSTGIGSRDPKPDHVP